MQDIFTMMQSRRKHIANKKWHKIKINLLSVEITFHNYSSLIQGIGAMKTTMATTEILLTEWESASGTDAYRLFHKKSRQTVAKMTAVFYEGMLY